MSLHRQYGWRPQWVDMFRARSIIVMPEQGETATLVRHEVRLRQQISLART